MKAMILAAGRGSRLAPLTDATPKPMLSVHGKPLIESQIQWLMQAGIREFVINLHHLGEQIEDHLGNGARLGIDIQYSHEVDLLETGGGIKHALPLLGDAPFALLNGDIWTDFDFNQLPSGLPSGTEAHLVVTPTPAWRSQGDFDYQDGRIVDRGSTHVYCGIALLTPQLLARDARSAFSLRDALFELIEQKALSAQLFTGSWLDIGTLDQYKTLTDQP